MSQEKNNTSYFPILDYLYSLSPSPPPPQPFYFISLGFVHFSAIELAYKLRKQ